jgi:hypothetical protein
MPVRKKELLNDCGSKSTNRLDSGELNSMLAEAIINTSSKDKKFEFDINLFKDESHANECVFSYSGTNWYGIYLNDDEGNPYYLKQMTKGKQRESHKLWFKVNFSESGRSIIKSSITHIFPPELYNTKQCTISDGKCVEGDFDPYRGEQSSQVKSKEPMLPSGLEEKLTEVSLSSVPKSGPRSKVKITRETLESMRDKDTLIDWMITNMEPSEILSCLGIESTTRDVSTTKSEKDYFTEIMDMEGNYGLREKYLNTVINYCDVLTDVGLKEDSGEQWVWSESIGWLTRNNFMKYSLMSFKGQWIPGKFLNAVHTWCPNIPGLRAELDKGEYYLRSDFSWNDGWISKTTIKDCLEDDTMPGYSFGKRRRNKTKKKRN